MALRPWIASLVLLPILLGGCKKDPAAALVGEWDLFMPMVGKATMTFDKSTFKEHFPGSSSGFGIVLSGNYSVDGDTLTLEQSQSAIGSGKSELAIANRDPKSKEAQTFYYTMDWKGNDLVYLTLSEPAEMTVALARNGSKPDPDRIRMKFSITSKGGPWKAQRTGVGTLPGGKPAMLPLAPMSAAVKTEPAPEAPREPEPQQQIADQPEPMQQPPTGTTGQADPTTGGTQMPMTGGMPNPTTSGETEGTTGVPPGPSPTTGGGESTTTGGGEL